MRLNAHYVDLSQAEMINGSLSSVFQVFIHPPPDVRLAGVTPGLPTPTPK